MTSRWNAMLWMMCVCVLLMMTDSSSPRRVVAVGDLHGDLNQTLAVLRLTHLIDDEKHWIGGDTVFVQLGDVLDVGPDDIEIVAFLMNLANEAKLSGGLVEQLLGNHEIQNLEGDFNAVNSVSLQRSGGVAGRNKLLSMDSPIGAYLRSRDAIYVHGSYLFLHGGLSSSTSSKIFNLKMVDDFNSDLRRALVAGDVSPLAATGLDLNESKRTPVDNPILVRSILNVRCAELKDVLVQHFPGISTVVVGHVPHDSKNFEDWRLCGGSLMDIDFGMSRWKDGVQGEVAALIVEPNQTAHLVRNKIILPPWRLDDHPILMEEVQRIVLCASLLGIIFFVLVCVSLRKRGFRMASDQPDSRYGTF